MLIIKVFSTCDTYSKYVMDKTFKKKKKNVSCKC